MQRPGGMRCAVKAPGVEAALIPNCDGDGAGDGDEDPIPTDESCVRPFAQTGMRL